jgi:hypothetical protein
LLPVFDQCFSRSTKIVKVKIAKAVKVGQTHAINASYVAVNTIMIFLSVVNLYFSISRNGRSHSDILRTPHVVDPCASYLSPDHFEPGIKWIRRIDADNRLKDPVFSAPSA